MYDIIFYIVLGWALIATALAIHFFRKWRQKQTKAHNMGVSSAKGDIGHILGMLKLLSEYEQLILLSTPSTQPSLDLLGVKGESLDFIELKAKGENLKSSQNRVRRLVEEKKVRYVVVDYEFPKDVKVEERQLRNIERG